jgi:hypothetical protein
MADFVPYPDMLDAPARSDAAVAVDRHNAAWAKTFEGGTTNLATRARHTQDIKTYASDLEARRMEAQAKNLAVNKDAQDFYLRSKKLQLDEEKAHFEMADKKTKMDAAAQMAPLMFEAKKAQTQAQIANAARVATETAAKAKMAEQADLFQSRVLQAQAQYAPDSPEYERAIVEAGNTHGAARHDPAIQAQYMAAQKSLTSRAAIQSKSDAEKQKALDMEQRAKDSGLTRERIAPMGDSFSRASDRQANDPELSSLKKALGQAVVKQTTLTDPAAAAEYQPGIDALKAKIAEKEGTSTAKPSEQKVIKAKFVDGKLVTE